MTASAQPLTLWRGARLATMAGHPAHDPWGWIERGAWLCDTLGRLAWVGDEAALPAEAARAVESEHELGGLLATPGLIDCHTHLVYAGSRADEFERRLRGASYADIARAGGGIRATVAATRAADDETLFALALGRARTLAREGVTALEIKSGYGLSLHDEARCLRIARRVGHELGLVVRTTCLAAHALPPEFEGRPDAYVEALCGWLPVLQEAGLVDAVDAFCEHVGFSPAQTRRVFEAARALGLPVKLHAEQLSDQGGAALAAGFGALSCDHLEYLGEAGVRALAAAGTVAVLLPGAYHFLGETRRPPVAALRDAGVPIALATDHNPGTSPTLSPLLMMNLACTLFRLTPDEALRGFTVHAARALGLQAGHGSLRPGLRADVALWAAEHPVELACHFGWDPGRGSLVGGVLHRREAP